MSSTERRCALPRRPHRGGPEADYAKARAYLQRMQRACEHKGVLVGGNAAAAADSDSASPAPSSALRLPRYAFASCVPYMGHLQFFIVLARLHRPPCLSPS